MAVVMDKTGKAINYFSVNFSPRIVVMLLHKSNSSGTIKLQTKALQRQNKRADFYCGINSSSRYECSKYGDERKALANCTEAVPPQAMEHLPTLPDDGDFLMIW